MKNSQDFKMAHKLYNCSNREIRDSFIKYFTAL